jgi:hypothetical protein
MRICISGNDGITLCRNAPVTVNNGEIAVASNEELHAAPLRDVRSFDDAHDDLKKLLGLQEPSATAIVSERDRNDIRL